MIYKNNIQYVILLLNMKNVEYLPFVKNVEWNFARKVDWIFCNIFSNPFLSKFPMLMCTSWLVIAIFFFFSLMPMYIYPKLWPIYRIFFIWICVYCTLRYCLWFCKIRWRVQSSQKNRKDDKFSSFQAEFVLHRKP